MKRLLVFTLALASITLFAMTTPSYAYNEKKCKKWAAKTERLSEQYNALRVTTLHLLANPRHFTRGEMQRARENENKALDKYLKGLGKVKQYCED